MRRLLLIAGQTIAAALLAAALIAWLGPTPAPPPQVVPPPVSELHVAPAPASEAASSPPTPAHASYRGAVRAAMPSVVNIYTSKALAQRRFGWLEPGGDYGYGAPPRVTSLGSGVIWAADGVIVTNNHVIDGADEIAVVIGDKTPLVARVLGTDAETDLGVLRVQANGLPSIVRGRSRQLEVGDVVLAIGNPFGVGQTVTQGIVSATRRNHLGINTFEDFLQTDAAINPGNSGGALVDTNGALVGINTAIYTRSEGSVGIGFAIPVELVEGVVTQLLQTGQIKRGYLGARSVDLSPDVAERLRVQAGAGVVIVAVETGGPAARAGLKPGDVIRQAADQPVTNGTDLVTRIAAMRPSDNLSLKVERGGQTLGIDVRLGQRPAPTRIQERP